MRSLLLLVGVALTALAAACFLFPFFSRAEGRFVPMLFSVIPGFLAWLALSLWRGTGGGEAHARLTHAEQRTHTEADFRKTRAGIEAGLAEKKAKLAHSFFMAPMAKSRLRKRIGEDEALLRGLDAMEGSWDRYQDRREAGLPPETPLQRLQAMFRPPAGPRN